MNILVIGGSGLIGSRIIELLSKKHTFTNLSLETGIDITKPHTLSVIKSDTDYSILLHLAAKADVDSCEKDKQLGEKGDAWRINVLGTQNIVDACRKSKKKYYTSQQTLSLMGENLKDLLIQRRIFPIL